MPNHKIHHGRNVKGFREMLGIKQKDLASNLGDDWGPIKVFILEQKETIHECLLEEIAKALKIPTEAFREFSWEDATNSIGNNMSKNTYNYSVIPIWRLFGQAPGT
ncbi:XRE family transcriptional regulator [Niabella sp. CJ426]|uniref:XRE family transcriptional regulator n=1 Tax=Niabella sp. CJ426 TaxID=3393740 RepID=UPI003CFCB3CD